ncbi:MAG: molybdenum cofactor guanylyltransferase [Betaproteobacteria bacterium]|nr:molybdenum cofactor guanylyltransferase [Betaproteobacteria bacterium]
MASADITAVILAGGLARRMGGVDKGLQLLHGQPMVQQVLHRLQPQVGQALISANRHLDDYERLGVPVCSDSISGYAGPLAGIHAAMLVIDTPYLLSAPCDSPLLPIDLVSRLSSALAEHQADAAVVVTGDGNQQQRHPVFLLLRSDLRSSLEQYLNQGQRKVDDWLASLNCVEVPFDDEGAFVNLNTPEDIQVLLNVSTKIPGSRPAPG